MNEDSLRLYLEDHLALLKGEIALARRCRRNNPGTALAVLLEGVGYDLELQAHNVGRLLERIGGAPRLFEQGALWLLEKAGRLRASDARYDRPELSRLIELETLILACHERIMMWDTLARFALPESVGEEGLVGRMLQESQDHLSSLEQHRLSTSTRALDLSRAA